MEELRAARTVEEAAGALGRLWREVGFELSFLAPIRAAGASAVAVDTIHGSWPEAEKRRYRGLRCWEFDPLVRHCLSRDGPIFVHNDDLRRQSALRPRHRRVLEREFSALWPARAAVSARDRDGTVWMLAGAGAQPPDEIAAIARHLSGALALSAWACEARMSRLGRTEPAPYPRLTERERECLLWLAAGLRNDRIAERLGIRGATVEMHLRNARRKLGARTREQAVARAVALRLVDP